MGNSICLYKNSYSDAECINMSNGLTSVFVSTLALSGSALAQTDRERELVVWLAEHDQDVVGIGTVSFSLVDIPWTSAGFEAEQRFLLKVIAAAQAQTGWERLSYSPNEELLLPRLAKFAQLVRQFTADHVDPSSYQVWLDWPPEYAVPAGFPRCPQHQVLLHWQGCVVCNDRIE
jgi:hypothetical protein